MDPTISIKLIDLNIQFYQTFASSFSRTRYTVQPGVKKIVDEHLLVGNNKSEFSILDLGCGNGNLAEYLGKKHYSGKYLGVDGSSNLVGNIQRQSESGSFIPKFQTLEITDPGWEQRLQEESFSLVLSFAVFHHIPGFSLRTEIFRTIKKILPQGGLFIHSNWQFMNSQKLSGRVVPWNAIGLSTRDVEPGDHLLDWRAETDQTGYRYVHLFSEEELSQHACDAGFTIKDSFLSDGKSGNLGLYQVWQSI